MVINPIGVGQQIEAVPAVRVGVGVVDEAAGITGGAIFFRAVINSITKEAGHRTGVVHRGEATPNIGAEEVAGL